MGMLHRLCEEEEWDSALEHINNIAERIIAIDNFGMWCSNIIDADDILYVLSVLEDDIHDAKEHDLYPDIDEYEDGDDLTDDEDFECEDESDDDDFCCETCDTEGCPYNNEPVKEFGDWSC